METALARLYSSRTGLRVLHYDLHQWNVKVYRGQLVPFDFEDLMWGFPVQDIAVSIYYYQRHEQYQHLRTAFKEGYTRFSEWPEQHPGEIDALMAGRSLELTNFVLQDPNPDYQREAPAFVERTECRLRALLDAR